MSLPLTNDRSCWERADPSDEWRATTRHTLRHSFATHRPRRQYRCGTRADRLEATAPSTCSHPRPATLSAVPQRNDASNRASRSSMQPDLVRHLMISMTGSNLVVLASSPLPGGGFVYAAKMTKRLPLPRSRSSLLRARRSRNPALSSQSTRSSSLRDYSSPPPTRLRSILSPRGPRLRPTELITASSSLT
jgi:hypothetical protein